MVYNIIGNGCFSSFLTKNQLNQKFVNPFIWCLIKYNDMYNLIKNYDIINWNNIKIIHDTMENIYNIILDDNITITYIHYKYDPHAKNYTVINSDSYYYDMKNYIKNKWFIRIKRMQKIKPIFCIAQTNKINLYTDNELESFANLKSNYPIIIDPNIKGNIQAANDMYNLLLNKKIIQ